MPGCFRPTSATQFISTHPHPCSRRSRQLLRICTRTARGVTGSRRSTRFGGTARAPCKLFTCRSRGDLRHSDASVAIPARPPRSLNHAWCLHLDRRAHFAEPAVTRTRLREPRRLPPDSVRTPLLAEETRFACAKVGPVSNIGSLGGTPPRLPLVSFRLRRLSLTRRCARGVPTRLALALVPATDRCDYESWGLKPEFPTSAVTKGRTGTPVSSS